MATKRDYPSIKEYADAQKELGSCLPQLRETMVKATQVGAGFGVPFGLYVAWRQQKAYKLRAIKPFAAQAVATWGVTFMTFTCLGLMTGVYNCLRVKM